MTDFTPEALAGLGPKEFAQLVKATPDSQIAEVTLYLKGVTLRACEASTDMVHSLNEAAEDLARQVKKHRAKRRHRREAKQASPRMGLG